MDTFKKFLLKTSILLPCFCALFFLHCTEVPDYGTLKVNASPADGGSISKNPSSSEYEEGTMVTLTVNAAPGYVFNGWVGNVAETDATKTTIIINGDDIVTATFVKKPDTPTRLTTTADEIGITIEWLSVPNTTGYRIYRSTSSFGTYAYIGTSTTNSHTDIGLSPGTTYFYKVTSCNNSVESSQSDYISGTTQLSVPTGITATINAGNITIAWSSVQSAIGYRIYRSTSPSSGYTQIYSTATTSYTDNTASSGTTYYYKVSAYNNNGVESSQSSYASATALIAPTGVTATASTTASSIIVEWSSVPSATGYRIHRSSSPSGTYAFIGTSTTNSYTDVGLSPSTTYYYKVSAYNNNGVEGLQSSYASATTNNINAPANVKATAYPNDCNIVITWLSVPNATEYRIYRHTSSSGTFTNQIGITDDDELTYTDDDYELIPGSTYYYKVTAYNDSNGESRQPSSTSAKFSCN